jgi:drug/metabolite transporter (DMT)-like permease
MITISAQISVIASMRYMPISIANLITMSTPVIVTPISFFLFKNQEGITYRTILGIILVLGGIFFIIL